MSDAEGDGEEAHDSATLASAFEAAVEQDRRDTDRAFEAMQEPQDSLSLGIVPTV